MEHQNDSQMTDTGYTSSHPLLTASAIVIGFLTPFFDVVTPVVQFLLATCGLAAAVLTLYERVDKIVVTKKERKKKDQTKK